MKILTAIHDHKAKRYGFIQTHDTAVDAERTLQQIIDSGNNDIAKYPEDFTLKQIGEYDTTDGKITAYDKEITLCSASNLVFKKQDLANAIHPDVITIPENVLS